MEHINRYFPHLDEVQKERFATMLRLYPEWNVKINVISRKDIENLELHHVVHSLLIGKFINWTPGTRVLDLGTGGGFPAIPLSVLFPGVQFHLVDRVGKKLRVATDVARQCGLQNVSIQHGDVREVKGKFDFVVSRAVMPLADMVPLVKRLIAGEQHNAMPNGLICLKGGELEAEIARFKSNCIIESLETYCDDPYFQTKKIVYLPL